MKFYKYTLNNKIAKKVRISIEGIVLHYDKWVYKKDKVDFKEFSSYVTEKEVPFEIGMYDGLLEPIVEKEEVKAVEDNNKKENKSTNTKSRKKTSKKEDKE